MNKPYLEFPANVNNYDGTRSMGALLERPLDHLISISSVWHSIEPWRDWPLLKKRGTMSVPQRFVNP